MKRTGGVFDDIVRFDNLYAAFILARRGKRSRNTVNEFNYRLEPELIELQSRLREGTYRPGTYRSFEVHDPKTRMIHALPFRDRIVQHAILRVLEPHFERWLDPDCMACRKGKGVDTALRRAVELSRRANWVLKSDIRSCFPSIDHETLLHLLRRKIKDRRVLGLLEVIVRHADEDQSCGLGLGKGLPIGSLTSQWFANLYLGCLDKQVRHELKPQGYLRYMDDFALLDRNRRGLLTMRNKLREWLGDSLQLEMKMRVTHVHSTELGWPFLGFRVSRQGLRLRRETWRRFQQRHGLRLHQYRRGLRSVESLQASVQCMTSHLDRAQSLALRQKEWNCIEI